jgi:hypothetical protein
MYRRMSVMSVDLPRIHLSLDASASLVANRVASRNRLVVPGRFQDCLAIWIVIGNGKRIRDRSKLPRPLSQILSHGPSSESSFATDPAMSALESALAEIECAYGRPTSRLVALQLEYRSPIVSDGGSHP